MEEHVRKSIDLIRKLETDQVYNLGFSGGKDSVVLLDLAKKSGVKFEPVYSNTTIDPPRHYPVYPGQLPGSQNREPERIVPSTGSKKRFSFKAETFLLRGIERELRDREKKLGRHET